MKTNQSRRGNHPTAEAEPIRLAMKLSDYLEDVHAVEQWREGITAHEIHLKRLAVRWFDAFLKRPPTLKDLSDLTLSEKQSAATQQFIVDHGRKPSVARACTERLFAIWRGIERRPPVVNATAETTLADLLHKHYAVARPVSASTLRSGYPIAIRSFGLFLEAPAKVKDLTTGKINGWLVWASERMAPHTLHGFRQVILCLWRFAFEESIVHEFPRKIRKIRRPRLVVEAWDSTQVGKLIAVAEGVEGSFCKTGIEKRTWWRAFVLAAWYTGLRLSDVLSIKAASIARMQDGTGRLTLVMQKTQEAIHRVFPADAMQVIDACLASGDQRDLILPLWCDRRMFYREFRLLAKAAGLNGLTKWLRRGSASEAEKLRPGAGRLHLGHQSAGLFETNYRCDRIVQPEITLPPSPVLQAALRRDGKAAASRKAVRA